MDLQIHRKIQHDPTTLIIRRQNTRQDSRNSTSRRTAQGIIGIPANTLIFEQNLSHKPDPALVYLVSDMPNGCSGLSVDTVDAQLSENRSAMSSSDRNTGLI